MEAKVLLQLTDFNFQTIMHNGRSLSQLYVLPNFVGERFLSEERMGNCKVLEFFL